MLLKEIALGIFNRKNVYQLRFNKQTWCITSLYRRCLPRDYDSGEYNKVVIQVNDNENEVVEIQSQLNVITINQFINLSAYFRLNAYERKEKILSILQNGISLIAKEKKWDFNALFDAYNCCYENVLRNEWLKEEKYLLSKDKKFYAGILFNWEIDKFESSVVFLNKQKAEIKRVKLFETEPHLVEAMGKMKWHDSAHIFYLYSKNEKHFWFANLDK